MSMIFCDSGEIPDLNAIDVICGPAVFVQLRRAVCAGSDHIYIIPHFGLGFAKCRTRENRTAIDVSRLVTWDDMKNSHLHCYMSPEVDNCAVGCRLKLTRRKNSAMARTTSTWTVPEI